MIIDGRAIAKEILLATKLRAEQLSRSPSFVALAVDPSPATESYLKMKRTQAALAGIHMDVRSTPHATTAELIAQISHIHEDAIIVQLPLPGSIDMHSVLDAIPTNQDADVLSSVARTAGIVPHPVAAAIEEVLVRHAIEPRGKRAVVIGEGWLVGVPAAEWLRSMGALVTVVTREKGNMHEALHTAEIVVSGAGVAGLIGKDDVLPGAVIIDIGTSELGGSIAGDVQPDVAQIASVFTPVPGGVGPITVACLLQNVVTLAEYAQQ